ncbi:hypothetical protein AQI95_37480 [Streptomyces yokosukanensis]|uniref:ATP-binding protein n=1 Tax=Streptomyces yokosukanensis TaxID=67386 RepID=A0A117PZC3_9ACTN|nr:hypothetical protein [Streptomyces yokosukanensis]KUM99665.1 hypothetical protein AQI95_37480 [Streptomyces yokosukanensis]
MKNLKAAALVVGTLAIAGTATPAVAGNLPAQGLLEDGKTVTRSIPNAAEIPTGALTENVRGATQGVKESGIVQTPVFGRTLPNPLNGKSPAKLPGKLPVVK